MSEGYTDVIYAWRRLRSAPAFTLFSILTLALGIGATTAIYSVVYAAVLRPPDIPHVDRVANLYHADPRRGGSGPMLSLSRPDYADYQAAQTSFEYLAAWHRFSLPFFGGGGTEFVMGEAVGGQYFGVVAVEPALGRMLQPADDVREAPRVMVLSDTLWRRKFGADPGVVGRTVKLGGETFEIVGVAPPSFRGVDMPNVLPTAAWIPLSAAPATDAREYTDRERRRLFAKGRLKSGVSMEQAQAEFRAIAQQLDAAHPIGTTLEPRFRGRHNTSRPWFLMPAANVKMHESVDAVAGPLVATIMIVVGLVLLVACTNIANLMLARGTIRRHENAVRLALGASRWRLIREQLVEAALVAVAGAAAALLTARFLMAGVLTAELRLAPGVVVRFAPEMNVSVAAGAIGSTLLALIVFGVIPAIQLARGTVREAIASDGQNAALPRWRGRRGLIACQVAVSAGLVSVAALCAQQVFAHARQDTGMDIDRLALVRVAVDMQQRGEAYGRRVLEQILEEARRLPGVESASLSSGFPIEYHASGGTVALTPERPSGGMYGFMVATPDVFRTWGVELREGRTFDGRDTAASEKVTVLTERMAHGLFGSNSAIGQRVFLQRRRNPGQPVPPVYPVTVIGIVSETDYGSVGNRGGGFLYLPWTQDHQPAMTVSLRTTGDPTPFVDQLRRLVNRIDPEVAIMDAGIASALGRNLVLRVGAAAAGLLGGLALILAMAGLYGVLTELVLQRTRELGIRMALGADARRLLTMVLVDGTRPVLVGLAIGLGCGVLLRIAFRPLFLRMLPAFDPVIVALVPLAFIAAALLASYVPARRAARVNPNVALRHL